MRYECRRQNNNRVTDADFNVLSQINKKEPNYCDLHQKDEKYKNFPNIERENQPK